MRLGLGYDSDELPSAPETVLGGTGVVAPVLAQVLASVSTGVFGALGRSFLCLWGITSREAEVCDLTLLA